MAKKSKTIAGKGIRLSRKQERESNSAGKIRIPWKRFFPYQIQLWLALIALSLFTSLLIFPNALNRPKEYRIGDIAEKDIKASHDILIENKELTEKDRQKAAGEVPQVYDFDSTASNLALRLKDAFSEARGQTTQLKEDMKATAPESASNMESQGESELLRKRFFEILDIAVDEKLFSDIEKTGFSEELEQQIGSVLSRVFEKGVVGSTSLLAGQSQKGIVLQSIYTQEEELVTDIKRFYDVEDAKEFIKRQAGTLRKELNSPELANLAVNMASRMIKPNITFNKRETEYRKELAVEAVKPFYYKIKKGEMLVREGERIEPEHLPKLTAEARYMGQSNILGRMPGIAILIGFLFAFLFLTGSIKFRYHDHSRELLFNVSTLLVLFLFIWAYSYIAEEIARGFYFFTAKALIFAMPVACGAMIITVFQGIGMAATFSLIISVLASLIMEGKTEFFMYFFISSLVAAHGVRVYRERGMLIKTGLKVALVNIILGLSIEMYYGSLYSAEALVTLTSSFIGGVLTGVIGTGIIPLVEMSFGFTTDMKLLELANLEQPLLKQLMVQAPGTYHHSVIVSNMVEATAEAIQANPLIAKVSAYYHDIGKMKKPLYFIENQMGRDNRHEKLAPSMSSLVLISHVKDGVELAKKYKLGKEIIDIIQQHHGKSLITFFYQKAKEQAENKGIKSYCIKEDDFRYPGPKPQTKEAGLVMLADMVEAASRSLVDSTPSRIQGVVQKIINKVFSDGQLDECELTLKDLHEIAKSFNKTLSGIFHHRIEYPEKDSKLVKKAGNGNTDQSPSEDPGGKKQEDKKETVNGLKRLGL
ncbi:MAG: HDIG domain-containing protein [Deltaproteobacteria bacterium]|nr:HDIG domain-containing protein [Deltaproteobacteria bacterium]